MTLTDALSFRRLCHEELSRARVRDGIGLLGEKRLHSVLKRWISDDFTTHEQKVTGRGEKKRKFVADVLTRDGRVFEIQTGKLYPLRTKLAFYMEQTNHPVTVVHPLLCEKHISWMDPETGEVTSRRRSPLREAPLHGIAQLAPFLPYLCDPRFSLMLPMITAEEFRLLDGWGKGGKRGSHRYELIPVALTEVHRLASREDYLAHFPPGLPDTFTAKEFAKRTKLRSFALYDALAVFEHLGAIRRDGKRGRAVLYCQTKKEPS